MTHADLLPGAALHVVTWPDDCCVCGGLVAELHTCACCDRLVCRGCTDEIGGLTHCARCAQAAREWMSEEVSARVPARLPRDGEAVLRQ